MVPPNVDNATQAILDELERREGWLRTFQLAAKKVLVPNPAGKVKRYVAMHLILTELGLPGDFRTVSGVRQAIISMGGHPTWYRGIPCYRGVSLASLSEAEADSLSEARRVAYRGRRASELKEPRTWAAEVKKGS